METLSQRLDKAQDLFGEVLRRLADELLRVGLDPQLLPAGPANQTELREDPYDHSRSLHAWWRTPDGAYRGSIQLSESGSLYAEFDVCRQHPQRPGWFIEAATAWGRADALRQELRLLPEPS